MTERKASSKHSLGEEFTKIQELIYELRVDQIMTQPVLTVSPTASMSDAKELMRSHRISGLPVVAGGALLGIVSVEDIIRWLEPGVSPAVVSDWMSRQIHTVRCDQAAVQALAKFSQHHVGRLPVLDENRRLVGIVTPGDIISQLLHALDARYREQEALRPRERCTLADLIADGTSLILRFAVAACDFDRAGAAATKIKRVLESFEVDPQVVRRAGIAAYEAEMNLTIHTTQGGNIQVEIGPKLIQMEAMDDGPGIPDLELAMEPGFSTAPDWIRELGFGAGMGLKNMKRCADDFSIVSEAGKGTRVRISIDLGCRRGAFVAA